MDIHCRMRRWGSLVLFLFNKIILSYYCNLHIDYANWDGMQMSGVNVEYSQPIFKIICFRGLIH